MNIKIASTKLMKVYSDLKRNSKLVLYEELGYYGGVIDCGEVLDFRDHDEYEYLIETAIKNGAKYSTYTKLSFRGGTLFIPDTEENIAKKLIEYMDKQ